MVVDVAIVLLSAVAVVRRLEDFDKIAGAGVEVGELIAAVTAGRGGGGGSGRAGGVEELDGYPGQSAMGLYQKLAGSREFAGKGFART